MPWAQAACPAKGCPEVTSGGRCTTCRGAAEAARGTAARRGYNRRHDRSFRRAVLTRDPICTCTDTSHGHGQQCPTLATVADHHPKTRRELVAEGANPNSPEHGRGLCKQCHDKHTAATSPGGWNAR